MNQLHPRLEHLPGDVLGLSDLQRVVYAGTAASSLHAPRALDRLVPQPANSLARPSAAAVAKILESQLSRFEPPVAVLDAVRRLGQPSAAVVAATARTGLLGGPLANLWSGLHAVRLARALEARTGTPTLPVLWVSGEAEPWHAHAGCQLADANFDRPRVALKVDGEDGRAAVGALKLDDQRHGLGSLRAQLRTHFDGRDGSEMWIEALIPRHGETLTRATARGLTTLLGGLGLIVVEPKPLRGATTRVLAELIGELPGPPPTDSVEAEAVELIPSPDPPGAAWVHHFEAERATSLAPGGDGFRYGSESGSRRASELAAELIQEPRAWAPGPALLPALLKRLLPVAALLVQPGELELAAELGALPLAAGAQTLETPPLVPALRATLFGQGEARSLQHLGWSSTQALRETATPEPSGGPKRYAKAPSAESGGPGAGLRAEGKRTRAALLALRPAVSEVDAGLATGLRRLGGRLERLIGDLAERVERAGANQSGKGLRHRKRLRAALRPGGRPQAENQTLLQPLIQSGSAWIEDLVHDLDPLPSEHLAVFLER